MKKSISKIMTIVLAFVAAICFVCAITMNTSSAKADGEQIFSVVNASVYGGNQDADNSGIRFTAQVNQAAFDAIQDKGDLAVFFGVELSVAGKATVIDVCFNVAGNTTGQDGFNKIDFNSKDLNEYRATLMYDAEQLAADLQKDSNFNPESLEIDAYKVSDIFKSYMQAAYETEITATAYYQIGNKTVAEKHTGGSLTFSIWGVASKHFVEFGNFDDCPAVEEKYFTDTSTLTDTVTVNEYGTITGYDFNGTEKAIYLNGKPVVVEDNKISTDLVEGVTEGEILAICVIDADGNLINLNAKYDMIAENVTTEAIYDATAQKIYYETADGVQIIDATNAYYVEDGSEYEIVKNEYLFNKKDAVQFGNPEPENGIADWAVAHHIDDLTGLNADLTVKDGDSTALKEVFIPYRLSTADYIGVNMLIKNDVGEIIYALSDVVLATAVIDDAAELKQVFNEEDIVVSYQVARIGNITKGVFMLADDIDASTGFTFTNSYWNFFDGLLDGRGHNIYNLNVSGTEDKPGNGLFSAISSGSSIQNIGFIDVVANYGSVFQGNLGEVNLWYQNTYSMHWNYIYEGVSGDNTGRGYPLYREQLGIPESDTTSLMTDYLSSVYRAGDGKGSGVFSNVFVRVAPSCTHLMGVVARNMLNAANNVRGYNFVIEYLPTDASAYANQTESGFGVLFGGAYTYNDNVAVNSWITPSVTWYTPTGTDAQYDESGRGALNYTSSAERINGFSTKIYVVSTVGLVSSSVGAILGTNEKAGEGQVQFFAQKTNSGASRLARFDSYEEIAELNLTTAGLLSTNYANTSGAEKFWTYNNKYLVWKNLPAKTPAEQA